MNLNKIKERVAKYKEEIDEAEERELAAKTNLIVAEARAENTNDEVDGLKRRLVLLQRDLENTQERLANNHQKLDRAEGRHGGDDELRQEFEATEME
ncbi:tropomyosin, partial [Salmonella sp. s54925]|uniref:tropomyosin n=1 Tax=Salmonella sp. s54925 TaxID=3159674 RepID=UPI00397F5DD7